MLHKYLETNKWVKSKCKGPEAGTYCVGRRQMWGTAVEIQCRRVTGSETITQVSVWGMEAVSFIKPWNNPGRRKW